MRNAFAAEISELAVENNQIVLMVGDIGNRLFNDYKARVPDRFFNCGVAEANMISMAAGLALSGLHPVTYTIAPFITTRCLEQIRIDVCYQNTTVVIVGVGAGLSYAGLGATHHSCEDIAHLRVLPNMTVLCPGDAWEVRAALRAALAHQGPVYIRLGKKNEPLIHSAVPQFQIGKGITIRDGRDVCLLSTGNMLPVAVEAAEMLQQRGISAWVVSLHTVKPLDFSLLREAFSRCATVVTIEEHSLMGGLGSSVAEWLVEQPCQRGQLVRVGTPDAFLHKAGGQNFARQRLGLTAGDIVSRVQKVTKWIGSLA